MGEGDLKELRELVEFLKASNVAEFDMERPELKVRLKFSGADAGTPGASAADLAQLARLLSVGTATAAAPVLTVAPPALREESHPGLNSGPSTAAAHAAGSEAVDEDAGLHIVRSPLVGTFYDASSPGADPFVKIGDTVASGKVLCIVEAMKIMNEIESDAAGEIVKVYAKPGQPVEYGQHLFGVRR